MIVSRVEKHQINKSDDYFGMLDHFCFLAKNLYNHANFLVRQEFIKNGKWLRYEDLDKLMRSDTMYPDYTLMPYSSSAQQTLRYLDTAWSSFFAAMKDYRSHPEKYLGKPKPPKYLDKSRGRAIVYLTGQNIHFKKDGYLHFPKTFGKFKIRTNCIEHVGFQKLQQCRIISRGNHVDVEIVYQIQIPDGLSDNGRYLAVDLGVDNLAAVANNVGAEFYIIDGKGLKSINCCYNKQVAKYKSFAKQLNAQVYTKRLRNLDSKRCNRVRDYLHKASRMIVNFAHQNDIRTIVIGKNDLWKQHSNLGHLRNQQFVEIPHAKLITMIQYKAEELGIQVVLEEEAYTSGTSFLDNEMPSKEFYNNRRRKYRGLFITNDETFLNADVNAAMQILRKHVSYPVIVNLRHLRQQLKTPRRLKVS